MIHILSVWRHNKGWLKWAIGSLMSFGLSLSILARLPKFWAYGDRYKVLLIIVIALPLFCFLWSIKKIGEVAVSKLTQRDRTILAALWILLLLLAVLFAGFAVIQTQGVRAGLWRLLIYGADASTGSITLPVLAFLLFYAPTRFGIRILLDAPLLSAAKSLFGDNLIIKVDYQTIFLVIFLFCMLLPLQQFPGKGDEFEKTFWGYDFLVNAYQNFRFAVLHDRLFDETMASSHKWLIYTGDRGIDDVQGLQPFTTAQLEKIRQNLDDLQDRLQKKDIKFLLIIPPNKNTIYPEYMPPEISISDHPSQLDQLLSYEKEHGKINIVDMRPALLQAKKDRQVYYAYDTHWNPYGAYIGYLEVMKALKADFPQLEPHPFSDYKIVSEGMANGDLGKRLAKINTKEERFHLEPLFHTGYIYRVYSSADIQYIDFITNSQSDLPKAIIYNDSFYVDLRPLLANHFSKSIGFWTTKIDENFIDTEKPDIVILEVTERFLERLITSP